MKYLRNFSVFIYCLSSHFAIAQNQSCCALPGWNYIRNIEIDNTAQPAHTNYQVLLILDTETPISEGKMNADGSDIRFSTNNCDIQFLNYWIEDGINTAQTEIWVLMPVIPADAIEHIYMYYGNAGAAPHSDFHSVFTNVLTISNTQTLNGLQTAEWIDIQSNGVVFTDSTVSFVARKIIISGGINGDNKGYAPGMGPGAGGDGIGWVGGGGAGYGGAGGDGGNIQAFGGSTYGTADGLDIDRGSGGGGSDCLPSAAGGGAVSLRAASIEMHGGIYMRGETAPFCCCLDYSEAAGGGSGGGILIIADHLEGSGTLSAKGGAGGESDTKEGGGGGGGGRIKLFSTFSNTFNGITNVSRGAHGLGHNGQGSQTIPHDGQPGTVSVQDLPDYITIHPEQLIQVFPVAGFSYSLCTGNPVPFNDLSDIASGSITGWQWDFGDGQTSIEQKPAHHYSTEGVYTVSLTVTSDSGCISGITEQVSVDAVPVAAFNFTDVCLGAPAHFSDASYINAPASIISWFWDFGDGQTSTQQNPSHTYGSAGVYVIMLTVSSGVCSQSLSQQITVHPVPVAAFNTFSVCLGTPVSFTQLSWVDAPATITSWQWDFGDGQASALQTPSHPYAAAGLYNVTLIVSSGTCIDTTTRQVEVYPVPLAAFSAADACSATPVFFSDASAVDAPATITAWIWDFGDGQTSTQQNPSHTYADAGSYGVTLAVTTTHGCAHTHTESITLFALPEIALSGADVLCAGTQTGAIETTVTGGTPDYIYSWNNNAASAGLNGLSGGMYAVTVTDVNNCTATGSIVIAEPSESLVLNGNIQNVRCFGGTDGSINAWASGGTGPYNYVWTNSATGDLNDSLPAGTYHVIVMDANGCTVSDSFTISEPPPFSLQVLPADTTLNFGMPLHFISSVSPDINVRYTWFPAYDLSCTNCAEPSMIGYESATYYIGAEDINGCMSYDTVKVTVLLDKVLYVPNAFTPNGDEVNDIFYAYTYGDKNFRMKIFDRWGSKIFDSEHKNHGWDGTAHGVPLNPGVYVYDVFVEFLDHTFRRENGSVTLIK